MHLNGELYTVIGVMPPDFQFPNPDTDLWTPMSFASNDVMATRDNHFIDAIARLKTGRHDRPVDVQSIGRQLEREFAENAGVQAEGSDYLSSVVGDVRPALLSLLGSLGIVLLIACVNVANLSSNRVCGSPRSLNFSCRTCRERSKITKHPRRRCSSSSRRIPIRFDL